ncbi:HpcH/HpaI aldolase/citrate lyase family protein [Pedomonas mirosovicensis]|uniref:HpcH/HpaI aldolase/citrate lyase family protein n=1 Tax=Pedomonas mirosovicensis TaxID=2908641 RepID=UPI0021671409|nr:CoA ester lyase [Pedomonas mirosovicensis]MCH8686115.1 CoA ester lyase [Pedomonas mirosovicensis]
MIASSRPRRSALYMPASNARALEKAKTLDCDVVIMDLEDAVAPEAKAEARAAAAEAVRGGDYGERELVIRINRLDTEWGIADVQAAVGASPHAILLPKVESASEVLQLEAMMEGLKARPETRIWCMIETPRGFLKLEKIAAASPRLACLVMGLADLVKDLRALDTVDRAPLHFAMSRAVMVARAMGLDVLDGMYPNIKDEDGLVRQCRQARAFGFDGKTLIHPSQIAPTNAAFAPSDAEVEQARRIIAAFEAAEQAGKGLAVLNGQMIEALHAQTARRVLAMAGER